MKAIAVDRAEPWHRRIACGEVDPDLFFPRQGQLAEVKPYLKWLCDHCPVRADCEAAMQTLPHLQRFSGQWRAGRWWKEQKGGYKPVPKPAETVAAGSKRADVPARGENAPRTASEGGRGTQDEMGDEG